jgi:hypothetical protein
MELYCIDLCVVYESVERVIGWGKEGEGVSGVWRPWPREGREGQGQGQG